MRYICMLIIATAMLFMAAGSARGITSPGPHMLSISAVPAPDCPPPPPPPPPRSRSCPNGPVNDDTPNGNCGEGNDSGNP
jgi:hypothetical protein